MISVLPAKNTRLRLDHSVIRTKGGVKSSFDVGVSATFSFGGPRRFETSFTKVKSESEEREIIANVFPVNQLTFRTA